jgi:hypothetical protein
MTRSSRFTVTVLASALLLLLTITGLSKSTASVNEREDEEAGTIIFGDSQVTQNRFAVRTFVPTGSLSNKCLATLAESNFAVPGISVFCGPREFQGQKGILFSAFFPQPIPAGLILSATVHQEDAHGYGPAVFFCTTDPNC